MTLAVRVPVNHFGCMNRTRRALAAVLDRMPVTIRELARQAGVPHSTLVLARDGKVGLTPDVARRVVGALRRMSADMAKLADRLEAATRERGPR